ncbi:MAG: aldehyde dehydrogenase family protein [Acidobacteria bacterium]|nr:aldehyde dehydrogenase family protein [Acidobacteriota bacterium]
MTATATSSVAAPEPLLPLPEATVREALDEGVAEVRRRKDEWLEVGVRDRIALLEEMINAFSAVGEAWAAASCTGEGIPADEPVGGEEWLVGPYLILRNLRLLRQTLTEIAESGLPRIPGPIRTREDGQVTAQVFPASFYDRILYTGVTAEVWMEPGVTRKEMLEHLAEAYRHPAPEGKVALVLGAGNVSSIGPTDALYKFFVENQVVIYKMHPLNAYLGSLIEQGFRPMVDRGFLRVVYGGAEVGAYLVDHPGIDEIHITGSHHTVETIAFGSGEEGQRRKEERRPRLTKRITAELGNVSPLIVVPGPWTDGDIAYQAENIASSLTNNAGFNCNATRVIVLHREWNQRRELEAAVRKVLAETPTRQAYYPGAEQRFDTFHEQHPEMETFGRKSGGHLPWALIPDLDPQAEAEICFDTEAFCGVTGETALSASSPAEFLDRAVDFANDTLWGTLNVTVIAHPASQRDPATRKAFDRAIANLRFGTVSINHWAGVNFGMMTTTWGAFPGHDLYDIQSGCGVVHNTLMFHKPQKTVLKGPFRTSPKPPWFVSHGNVHNLAETLADFETEPSVFKLPRLFWHALRP